MFDFTIIAAVRIVPAGAKTHPAGAALAILVCGVLVLIRHRSIEPATAAAPAQQR